MVLVRRALALACVAAAAVLLVLPARADQGSGVQPLLDGQVFAVAPLLLKVPDGAQVRIQDATGREVIPAAGSSSSEVRLPVLMAGTYFADVNGQVSTFSVSNGETALSSAPWGAADGPTVPLWAVAGLGAAAGSVLILGVWRRRLPVVLVGLAGAAGAAGVLIMGAASASAEDRVLACGDMSGQWSNERGLCVVEQATGVLRTGDVPAALVSLQDSFTCHDVGHELGRRAAALLPRANDALVPEAAICREGFVHGVMYSAAMYLSDEEYRDLSSQVCSTWPESERFVLASCAHGIGHGAVFRFSGSLDLADQLCADLFSSQQESLLTECRGGAATAWALLRAQAPQGEFWRLDDFANAEQACAAMTAHDAIHECYAGIAMSMSPPVEEAPEAFAALLGVCSSDHGADEYALSACASGVGKIAQAWFFDDISGASSCSALPEGRARTTCAVSFFLALQYDVKGFSDAPAVCSAAQVEWARCDEVLSASGGSQ